MLSDRRADALAALRVDGKVERVLLVELSIVWEGVTSSCIGSDEWAVKAAEAGRKWSNTLERRAAAKRLKYESDVLNHFPAQWKTEVCTVEIGARGIVSQNVVEKLKAAYVRLGPKSRRDVSKGGARRRAAALAVELGERAVLGSFVVWQKRAQEWDESRLLQAPKAQPLEERSLAEIDGVRQARLRRREEEAGAMRGEFVAALVREDDQDARAAEEHSAGNVVWRRALLDATRCAESDASAVRIYTDGSFDDGRAGWGWVAVRGWHVLANGCGPVVLDSRCPDYVGCNFHSNNSGEVSAVIHALNWAKHAEEASGLSVTIIPDSWWAIRAAKGAHSRHHFGALRRANERAVSVGAKFGWVKGHSEHVWNNEADRLADRGRLTVLSQNVVDRIQQPVDDHVRKNEHRDAG